MASLLRHFESRLFGVLLTALFLAGAPVLADAPRLVAPANESVPPAEDDAPDEVTRESRPTTARLSCAIEAVSLPGTTLLPLAPSRSTHPAPTVPFWNGLGFRLRC